MTKQNYITLQERIPEFDRYAPSLQDAVTSAIDQVEGSGVGVRVVRVETEAANTIAKINADLLGVVSG